MRLEIDARARRILRLLPRANIYSALELLLLLVLATQAARLMWTVVTPVGPLGNWRVVQPGPSGSAGEMLHGFDPFFRLEATTPSAQNSVVTALSLVLFGTRIDEAMGRGSAIIATPDGVQNSYSVGAEVMPGVTLKSVAFDHVTLTRGGVDEDLFLDQSNGAVPVTVPSASESSAALAGASPGMLSATPASAPGGAPLTLARLQSEIGFIPRIDGGKVTGLVVRPQGSGAVFKQTGFKEGDIVTQLGGRPIRGQSDVAQLASDFAKGGTLSIMVERGAEQLPLAVTLAGQ